MNRRQRFNLRRARIATFLAEQAEAWLHLDATRMSKRDAARWAACRDFTGLGECVIAWLHGDITQTPGHCGPPCDETIPLIPVLTA